MSDDDKPDREPFDSGATAASLALNSGHGTLDPRAAAFLEKQGRLIDHQIEELKREDAIRHWSLRVRHIGDVLKVAFEIAVAFIVIVLAAGIASALWSASHADGLVVEAFSVPPDLAGRGLTGEVVAAKVLDQLATMQTQTQSSRAAASYATNWGDDIKVQIPDTGVSIGELNRYLRQWLGHETHITGEIYRTAAGLAITARAGSGASPTFNGSDADFDKLIGKAAESVYRSTQPYRYAVYLDSQNRSPEARGVYQQLIVSGSPADRAWARIGLENQENSQGGFTAGIAELHLAIREEPGLLLAYENLANNEGTLQHDEASLKATQQAVALAVQGHDPTLVQNTFAERALEDKAQLAAGLGNFLAQMQIDRQVLAEADPIGNRENVLQSDVSACGSLHDARCMHDAWAALPAAPPGQFVMLSRIANRQIANVAIRHWKDAAADEAWVVSVLAKSGRIGQVFLDRAEAPISALVAANMGDLKTANEQIAKTPLDCVVCLRYRGRIAALEKNWPVAQMWFRKAIAAAPSVPFGYTDYGEMLLAKGDYDGAIAQFALAHEKGPHFADPLELWGEALIARNRSDLALEKFAEANRYAPNWGRLHLKWGKALFYAGQKDEARKQYAVAATLDLSGDLSGAEKFELARLRAADGNR
jgi:predicted Zn-dependent protease